MKCRTMLLPIASIGMLAACSSGTVQETLGLDRAAPDEFRVVSRPPLAVPPEFNLRPPGDTSDAPAAIPVQAKAQTLIRNGGNESELYQLPSGDTETVAQPVEATKPASAGSADAQFLLNAGADKADHSVRDELREERVVRQIKKEDQSWWGSLWSSDKQEPVIDAGGEAKRIQTNQEQGKPVNEGEVKQSKGGWWSRVFGE